MSHRHGQQLLDLIDKTDINKSKYLLTRHVKRHFKYGKCERMVSKSLRFENLENKSCALGC